MGIAGDGGDRFGPVSPLVPLLSHLCSLLDLLSSLLLCSQRHPHSRGFSFRICDCGLLILMSGCPCFYSGHQAALRPLWEFWVGFCETPHIYLPRCLGILDLLASQVPSEIKDTAHFSEVPRLAGVSLNIPLPRGSALDSGPGPRDRTPF